MRTAGASARSCGVWPWRRLEPFTSLPPTSTSNRLSSRPTFHRLPTDLPLHFTFHQPFTDLPPTSHRPLPGGSMPSRRSRRCTTGTWSGARASSTRGRGRRCRATSFRTTACTFACTARCGTRSSCRCSPREPRLVATSGGREEVSLDFSDLPPPSRVSVLAS